MVSATPTSGTVPVTVSFNGSGSSDADGSIVSYAWAFGDGGTASGATASHAYGAAGTYNATLTVTDDGGATSSASTTITVTAPAPLTAPTKLSGSASGGNVTLNWRDNSSNEDGFFIERAPKAGTFSRIGQVGANVKTFITPVTTGTWIYRVQAFKGAQVSGYSNQVSIRVR